MGAGGLRQIRPRDRECSSPDNKWCFRQEQVLQYKELVGREEQEDYAEEEGRHDERGEWEVIGVFGGDGVDERGVEIHCHKSYRWMGDAFDAVS